jgi:TRAP-type uncharacterized transport system substrate-binding protein
MGRVTIGALLSALAFLTPPLVAEAAPKAAPEPVQLTIGGGAVESAAFRWSSALAEIVSRPPGLPDCEPTASCGVPGVVAGAQTYDDAPSLLKALLDGSIATAVMPANPIFTAHCGAMPGTPAASLSVLKILYRQPLYIIVRSATPAIAQPRDWARKTVVTGITGSDSELLTDAMLETYGVPRGKLKILRLPPTQAFAAMRNGAAAIGIFLGHVHDRSIAGLIEQGFTLMSLPDTPERARLLERMPVFEVGAIPPGTYSGVPATSTLTQPMVWVAGPAFDQSLAGKLVADISEPHNMSRLAELAEPTPPAPEGVAFQRLPAPLTSGAREFAARKHLPVDVLACPGDAAGHG